MSWFVKLHDKEDHAELAIRADDIRAIYDIDIESGTQICFDSYNKMESIYVEESVSEILRVGFENARKEERSGKWIETEYEDCWRGRLSKCSICKNKMVGTPKFCPDCGAFMWEDKGNENRERLP